MGQRHRMRPESRRHATGVMDDGGGRFRAGGVPSSAAIGCDVCVAGLSRSQELDPGRNPSGEVLDGMTHGVRGSEHSESPGQASAIFLRGPGTWAKVPTEKEIL
jgi:hypothetical protein